MSALVTCLLAILLLGAVSCGDGGDDGTEATVEQTPVDPGGERGAEEVEVVMEYILMDGEPAPPNPVTGAVTPPERNLIGFQRARMDTGDEPPAAVEAILLLAGGHTLGGSEFRNMADQIVRLSGGTIEVWMQERRSHFLEDNSIMELAEERQDPHLAWRYYIQREPVEGKTFAGFLNPKGPETEMMSEWSLDVELADLHRIISLLPPESRPANVFLGGHSRGAAFTQAYAAYRFDDGHRGTEDLAGMVLIDGGALEKGYDEEDDYLRALQDLRDGSTNRYLAVPFGPVGGYLYSLIEILSMAATEGFGDPDDPTLGPGGVWPYNHAILSLLWVMNRGNKVTVTNEALLASFISPQVTPVKFFSAQIGQPTGGPMEEGIGGRLVMTDDKFIYSWERADKMDPPGASDVQLFYRGMYEGPSNTFDRYYAMRWDTDLQAAWHANYETAGTWRARYFDMSSAAVDAPVYAIATRMLVEKGDMEAYRDRLGPVRGTGLPRTEAGFRLLSMPEWEHLDPVLLREGGEPFYPDLVDWMRGNASGTVQVPRL